MRSFTSVIILKKEFVYIAEKDLQIRAEAIRDTIQTVESMHTESASALETLRTGLNPAQFADTVETFIRSMMEMVTGLASLVTGSDAHGRIVSVGDSMTPRPNEFKENNE